MKSKAIAAIMTMLFLVSITAIATPVRAPSSEVWVPTQYPTIQEGVNAVADGGIVHVLAGIYYERVMIEHKSLTLVGESKFTTIIDGSGIVEIGVVALSCASNVEIRGFTIRNGLHSGIQIWGSDYSTITDNIIRDSGTGVNTDSNHAVINRNVIYNDATGICIYAGASYNLVTFNVIFGNSFDGISIHRKPGAPLPTGNTIRFNLVTENGFGIRYPTLKENPEAGNTILTVIKYPPAYDNAILLNTNTENMGRNWVPYYGYWGC